MGIQPWMRAVILAVGLCVICSSGMAQESAPKDAKKAEQPSPRVVTLLLAASAEPTPCLRYQLLPDMLDQRLGNAYPQMLTTVQLVDQAFKGEDFANAHHEAKYWLKRAAGQIERERIDILTRLCKHALGYADVAARCRWSTWDIPFEEVGVQTAMPDFQKLRFVTRVLALQVRLAVADGDFDGALHRLQTAVALAHAYGRGPTLINKLVAVANLDIAFREVEEWIGTVGSPNLYWALTELPVPFVSLRTGARLERSMLFLTCPALRDIGSAVWTEAQTQAVLDRLVEAFGNMAPSWKDRATIDGIVAEGLDAAKAYLVEAGHGVERIETLPAAQVVLWADVDRYEKLLHEQTRWLILPYPEAAANLHEVAERIEAANAQGPVLELLPRLEQAATLVARAGRNVAILRCIEAIRIHLGQNDGQLPETLDAITAVPVPHDPMTGQPFEYQVEDARAVLIGKTLPTQSADDGVHYRLMVKP